MIGKEIKRGFVFEALKKSGCQLYNIENKINKKSEVKRRIAKNKHN